MQNLVKQPHDPFDVRALSKWATGEDEVIDLRDAEEDALHEAWALGDYDNGESGCPNCGRSRLCKCPNGKHRCEKCNWVPEDKGYCEVSM